MYKKKVDGDEDETRKEACREETGNESDKRRRKVEVH